MVNRKPAEDICWWLPVDKACPPKTQALLISSFVGSQDLTQWTLLMNIFDTQVLHSYVFAVTLLGFQTAAVGQDPDHRPMFLSGGLISGPPASDSPGCGC